MLTFCLVGVEVQVAQALTTQQAKSVVAQYARRFKIYKTAQSKNHQCWIKRGRVACKALTPNGNSSGQLGNGEMNPATVLKANYVFRIRDAVSIVVGDEHTCVLHKTSEVSCFGSSRFGQLAQGDFSGYSIPRKVLKVDRTKLKGVRALVARGNETCALLKNQDMACWGQSRILGTVSTHASVAFNLQSLGVRSPLSRRVASKR